MSPPANSPLSRAAFQLWAGNFQQPATRSPASRFALAIATARTPAKPSQRSMGQHTARPSLASLPASLLDRRTRLARLSPIAPASPATTARRATTARAARPASPRPQASASHTPRPPVPVANSARLEPSQRKFSQGGGPARAMPSTSGGNATDCGSGEQGTFGTPRRACGRRGARKFASQYISIPTAKQEWFSISRAIAVRIANGVSKRIGMTAFRKLEFGVSQNRVLGDQDGK